METVQYRPGPSRPAADGECLFWENKDFQSEKRKIFSLKERFSWWIEWLAFYFYFIEKILYLKLKIYRKSVINYNVKSTWARNPTLDLISYHRIAARSCFQRKFFSNRWTQRDYFGLTSSKALYKRLVAVNNWVAISCFSPNKFSW